MAQEIPPGCTQIPDLRRLEDGTCGSEPLSFGSGRPHPARRSLESPGPRSPRSGLQPASAQSPLLLTCILHSRLYPPRSPRPWVPQHLWAQLGKCCGPDSRLLPIWGPTGSPPTPARTGTFLAPLHTRHRRAPTVCSTLGSRGNGIRFLPSLGPGLSGWGPEDWGGEMAAPSAQAPVLRNPASGTQDSRSSRGEPRGEVTGRGRRPRAPQKCSRRGRPSAASIRSH